MYLVVCLCYSFDLELVAGEHESSDKASTPTGEEQLPEYSKELDDVTKSETGEMDSAGGREVSGSEDTINIPSPIPELDELIQNDDDKVCEDGRESCMFLSNTVNCEYFDVKIFSDSMACAKIKRTKYMRYINDNAVQGHLSENYLTRKIIA